MTGPLKDDWRWDTPIRLEIRLSRELFGGYVNSMHVVKSDFGLRRGSRVLETNSALAPYVLMALSRNPAIEFEAADKISAKLLKLPQFKYNELRIKRILFSRALPNAMEIDDG